jgi:hypothetical protein
MQTLIPMTKSHQKFSLTSHPEFHPLDLQPSLNTTDPQSIILLSFLLEAVHDISHRRPHLRLLV